MTQPKGFELLTTPFFCPSIVSKSQTNLHKLSALCHCLCNTAQILNFALQFRIQIRESCFKIRVKNMPDTSSMITVLCAEALAQSLHDNPVPKHKKIQQLSMKYCIALFAGKSPIALTPMAAVLCVFETVSMPKTTRQLYTDLLKSGKYSDIVLATKVFFFSKLHCVCI